MATYTEIRDLFPKKDDTEELYGKVEVSLIVAALNLVQATTPTAADKAYAAGVFDRPKQEAKKIMMAVLASNKDQTVVSIKTASDAAVQTAVDSVVPAMVDALAGV